jgi:catechol 2,3-dioxygenase-like lactoylglutathione lyase family enzyme
MKVQGITKTVADLERSRRFYEDVLGFEPDAFYEPTRWQSCKTSGATFFAVGEPPGSTDETAFFVPDVEALWERVKDKVEVVEPLAMMPWGSYKFVVRDPDGHLLAFVQGESVDE